MKNDSYFRQRDSYGGSGESSSDDSKPESDSVGYFQPRRNAAGNFIPDDRPHWASRMPLGLAKMLAETRSMISDKRARLAECTRERDLLGREPITIEITVEKPRK